MTLMILPHESWEFAQGAPQGPNIDLTVASSRPGHGPYRIIRDRTTAQIIHQPACEAWRHRPRVCRHVAEALRRSEQPAQSFLEDVRQLLGADEHRDPAGYPISFRAAVQRAYEQARDQIEATRLDDQLRASLAALSDKERVDDAVVAFGGRS